MAFIHELHLITGEGGAVLWPGQCHSVLGCSQLLRAGPGPHSQAEALPPSRIHCTRNMFLICRFSEWGLAEVTQDTPVALASASALPLL